MKTRFFLLVVCMRLFTSTALAAEVSEERQAIRKIIEAQEQAWNKGDIEAFMEGYARSPQLRFASGGSVFLGWDATLQRYKSKYPNRSAMGKLTFSEVTVDLLSSDSALVFGRWQLKRDKDAPAGLFTVIFRKTQDGWRIVHDHTSVAD